MTQRVTATAESESDADDTETDGDSNTETKPGRDRCNSELCVLAATVPDCSRQLKLQFAVCTVADFLSISFRLQSSKMVMSSNVIFELQLVIVVRLSCWSTASWRASHTEPRTGGELVHEPLRVRLQSGGNFFASI